MSNFGHLSIKKPPDSHQGVEETLQSRRSNETTACHITKNKYTLRPSRLQGPRMLEHLVQFEPDITSLGDFRELDDVSSGDLLSAQVATTEWLKELGVTADEKINTEAQTTAAREAFNVVTTNTDDATQKSRLLQLKTPEAVRHITGMLTAYDWEFVEMAKELRGYTVAKLFEETQSPNANIRLKALGLLGKVTEVGLFTDKIEVKKTDLTDEEIDRKLKDKLAKFMGVQDADVVEDIEINETERPDAESN